MNDDLTVNGIATTNALEANDVNANAVVTDFLHSGSLFGDFGSFQFFGANDATLGTTVANHVFAGPFNAGGPLEAGVMGAADPADLGGGPVTAGVHGSAEGHLGPGDFGVFSTGDLGATGAKLFIQPHPTDPAREVRFVCLEGNESGTYFRGSGRVVDGEARIEVPEEFRWVTETEGLTVQLTPMGARAVLWVESQDLERIVVKGDADVEFHYFVNGVRRGYGDLEIVGENRSYVPTYRDVPFGRNYPEGIQQILIENGTLNPDLTPNEGTAAALGRTLQDMDPEHSGVRVPAIPRDMESRESGR